MKSKPLISIIVPVYNSELYIEECISSILRLNLNKEIIIVDDESTDFTLKKLEQFSNYPEIILIQQSHGGVSSARNNGLSMSTGDYIGFVDSDDTINVEQFESFFNSFVESNAEMAIGGTEILNYDKTKELRVVPKKLCNTVCQGQYSFYTLLSCDAFVPLVFNYLYKKSLIDRCNIQFHHQISEDDLWTTSILCLARSVLLCEHIHYTYKIHPESITNSNRNSLFKADNLVKVADDLLYFSASNELENKTKVWLYCEILYTYSASIQIFNKLKVPDYKINIEQIKDITKYVLSFTDMKAKRIAITYYYRIMHLLNSTNNETTN